MSRMRGLLSLWIGSLLALGSGNAGGIAGNYSQTYAILIKGEVAGHESVMEKTAENGDLVVTSEHDLMITDRLETKRMAFSTRMVLAKGSLKPISYLYKYAAGDAGDFCEVVVKDSQLTRVLNRGGRISEVTVPFKPEMVILDFSVYHHYDYLIRKYDVRKGGRQLFLDFVPPVGDAIPVALTMQEAATLDRGKEKLPVSIFLVEFVGIYTGIVTADKDGRLVRLVIPAQDLEVVRKDLLAK